MTVKIRETIPTKPRRWSQLRRQQQYSHQNLTILSIYWVQYLSGTGQTTSGKRHTFHEVVLHVFTIHGKLITHPTRRTVDESGAESTEELHFFCEGQSVPAFVEYTGVKYHYIHNAHGDFIGIIDAAGNPVIEWGWTQRING